MTVSAEAANIIGSFILAASVIGIILVVVARRQAAKFEERQAAARARGWTLEKRSEHGFRIYQWTGSTDGVRWVAESAEKPGSQHRKGIYVARWHGSWTPGINDAIVVMAMPKGPDRLVGSVAEGEGLFARLAKKATGYAFDKSIDGYFGYSAGQEVDAAALQRVDTTVPGVAVMAANKDEGARVLREGFEQAVVSTRSQLSDDVWILLRPQAVSLGRMSRFRDIDDVDGFVRAGVALTRAFKFGHR